LVVEPAAHESREEVGEALHHEASKSSGRDDHGEVRGRGSKRVLNWSGSNGTERDLSHALPTRAGKSASRIQLEMLTLVEGNTNEMEGG